MRIITTTAGVDGERKENSARCHVLEWSGVLPPPNPPRAINCANGAASIAISASVRHALGAGIGIPWAGRHGRRSRVGGERGAPWVHGGATRVGIGFARNDGNRIGAQVRPEAVG